MTEQKKVVVSRLPKKLHEKFTRLTKEARTTPSDVIREMVESYCEDIS